MTAAAVLPSRCHRRAPSASQGGTGVSRVQVQDEIGGESRRVVLAAAFVDVCVKIPGCLARRCSCQAFKSFLSAASFSLACELFRAWCVHRCSCMQKTPALALLSEEES